MGLTLLAIFTAALLLPGIVAARAFYFAGQTAEVEVPVPGLSTPSGLTLVGTFSVLVHVIYIALLGLALRFPSCWPFPVSDPYRILSVAEGAPNLPLAWSFFSGILLLCALAWGIGLVAGHIAIRSNKALVYGPLADVIDSGRGDDTFITAYVLTKITANDRVLGYQGAVDSLIRDEDRVPKTVILRDVVPFYLDLKSQEPVRREGTQVIDWLTLRADDWHNIAFRVIRAIDDTPERPDSGDDG